MTGQTARKRQGSKSFRTGTAAKKGAVADEVTSPGKLAPLSTKQATFILYAPRATQVFVAGSFNNWNPVATPLMRSHEGLWSNTVDLYPGEYEYRFIVDGVWTDDPTNMMRQCNEFGTENCILAVRT